MTALTILGFWFIISRLADVDFDELWNSLKGATWGWVFIALLTRQLARVRAGRVDDRRVQHDLPLGPTVALHFALTFINVAVPSDRGKGRGGDAVLPEAGRSSHRSAHRWRDRQLLRLPRADPDPHHHARLRCGLAELRLLVSSPSIVDAGHVLALALILVVARRHSCCSRSLALRRWVDRFRARGDRRDPQPQVGPKRVLLLFGGNIAGEIVFASTLGVVARSRSATTSRSPTCSPST